MIIRALLKRDAEIIRKLHSKFFGDEFSINGLNGFMTSFAAVDNDDRLVMAAGIRPIMEAIMVTDKDIEISQRRAAGLEILETMKITTRLAGYNELHCFVQDEKWMRHLLKYGFKPTIGKSLVMGV